MPCGECAQQTGLIAPALRVYSGKIHGRGFLDNVPRCAHGRKIVRLRGGANYRRCD